MVCLPAQVMCDTYEPPRLLPDGTVTKLKPLPTNTRAACADAMERAKEHVPWFGIEQVRSCGLLPSGSSWVLRSGRWLLSPQGWVQCTVGHGLLC